MSEKIIGYKVYRYYPLENTNKVIFSFDNIGAAMFELGYLIGQGYDGHVTRVVEKVIEEEQIIVDPTLE